MQWDLLLWWAVPVTMLLVSGAGYQVIGFRPCLWWQLLSGWGQVLTRPTVWLGGPRNGVGLLVGEGPFPRAAGWGTWGRCQLYRGWGCIWQFSSLVFRTGPDQLVGSYTPGTNRLEEGFQTNACQHQCPCGWTRFLKMIATSVYV